MLRLQLGQRLQLGLVQRLQERLLQVRRQGRWEVLHLPGSSGNAHMLDPGADRAVLQAVGRTGVHGAAATLVQRGGAWSLAA